ncbi:hypothetical protein OH76DRAFT_288021 [Lentinus brumalis]|uniref:Uncharacterized protein n=1 Tax=Lentinus brumalis TaxID=2498619 RepID=A0A371CKK5_9APHY|nr:hypothetical protein OH76DRAFT_288021 [Polyporus brumalis]
MYLVLSAPWMYPCPSVRLFYVYLSHYLFFLFISSLAFRSPCCLATPPFPALTLSPLIPYTRNLMYLHALLLSFPHRCDLATVRYFVGLLTD